MTKNSDMPAKQNGLVRRKDSTVYWFEIRAPKDLAHIYPSRYAHRVSLGTRDPKEAKVKAAQLWAEWQARFEQQRCKPLTFEKVTEITPEMATALAETMIRESLAADERLRTNPTEQAPLLRWMQGVGKGEPTPHPQGGMPDELADMLESMNSEHDQESGKALARGRLDSVLPALQYAGQKLGIVFDRKTPGVDAALAAALKARKIATEAKVRRDQGHIVETPAAASKSPPARARKLRDAFDQWRKSVGVTRDAGTVRAKELALEDYEAFPGATPLDAITREQGHQFKAWILAKATLAPKTKHQRLTDVKTLIKYAAQELEWIPRSPWVGIDIEYGVTTPRKPWTPAQLSALFSLPLFAEYSLPHLAKAGADAGYWIPLLGLFTGARMGELCQLRTTDIHEEDGIWGIAINDDDGKSVKTSAAVRWVPVHSELARLGLLEYADTVRKAKHASLWPNLSLMDGKPSHGFSAWFNSTLCKSVKDIALPDFHSFRHTVRTKMHKAGISERVQDAITGHEARGSEGTVTYTHVDHADRVRAIESVNYPGLVLRRVYSAP